MSNVIQLLPDHVANQIAAGEVVQRPASVVKELIENAVDAQASDIKLIIKDAGKTLVQVIDNGLGMNNTDARLCFERHATSKIRQAEDLFAIHTKGFRGEALASIAAIAHVVLKTKQDQQELGVEIVIEGSKIISQEPTVSPKGTSFAIKNLFYNIPARRNFLKSDTIEFRHIVDEFQRVALAHPNIHFSLIHNGSDHFILPQANLRQRIVALFGGKTNEKLVPIQEQTEIVSIQGFIAKPEFAKKSRGEQFFFVNKRFIKSGYLHHAVLSAFEGLLKEGMQPSYFIYLDVLPHTIDINIHPTKTEIKFDDEQALYAILRATVKHSLGQFNVAPVLDFERDSTLDVSYEQENKGSNNPLIQVDSNFNPFETSSETRQSKQHTSHHFKNEKIPHWENLYVGLKEEAKQITEIEFEGEIITGSLFESDTTATLNATQTYQLQRKYIVSPLKSGILVLNQNRAHQRILYEKYLENITLHKGSSQQLLFPLVLEFAVHEMNLIRELEPTLFNIGFVFTFSDTNSLTISGIPVMTNESEIEAVIIKLIRDLQDEVPDQSFSRIDAVAKSLAKNFAIKNGVLLNNEEQEQIVNRLFACKDPNHSPFQKPTFITWQVEDIDKRFYI
uniref:DNA mismatch repair endonuclease MutL n=1 Tax=Flavobacterium sp. TaxID=239 RepID=UPI00404AF1FD